MPERADWDDTWMAAADTMAKRSFCDRRQIGAVIVDANNRIVATGYNGPPAGQTIEHVTLECVVHCPRANGTSQAGVGYDDCLTIHAEANALLFCDRRERDGGTIYSSSIPCLGCAKLIANSGLARVVTRLDIEADKHREPWRATELLEACGISLTYMK